jgi:S1-C subfamily serine protease
MASDAGSRSDADQKQAPNPEGKFAVPAKGLSAMGGAVQAGLGAMRSVDSTLEVAQNAGMEVISRLLGQKLIGNGSDAAPRIIPTAGWGFGGGNANADSGAQAKPGARLLDEERNNVEVFERAAPSVVAITNLAAARTWQGMELVPKGKGSGFVWDKEGHIVTNFHVAANGDAFMVTLKDGSEVEARFVGGDPRKDIAVLKVSDSLDKLVPIERGDSGGLRVGQKAIAIGSPFGLNHTLTTGVVSALNRKMGEDNGATIQGMIQTSASINPGSSGGPLLDSEARLMGMNTMILNGGGGGNVGVGFAVPINTIQNVVARLLGAGGNADHPTLGLSVFSEEQKMALGITLPGVVVREVYPGTPAAKAGLTGIQELRDRYIIGDAIVAIDGQPVRTYDDLYDALDHRQVGDSVRLGIRRASTRGGNATVTVRLESLTRSPLARLRGSPDVLLVGQAIGARADRGFLRAAAMGAGVVLAVLAAVAGWWGAAAAIAVAAWLLPNPGLGDAAAALLSRR